LRHPARRFRSDSACQLAGTYYNPNEDTPEMLERLLGTQTFLTAQGALDGLSARHSALSDNIANVNTPGYKRKTVPFEQALERAVQSTVSPCTEAACGPMKPFSPPVVREMHTSGRTDGNNVDVEREMVLLAENTLRYQTITQYVGGFFSGLKMVINSGR
jgi:flagellar basal-body rod protein FlgB